MGDRIIHHLYLILKISLFFCLFFLVCGETNWKGTWVVKLTYLISSLFLTAKMSPKWSNTMLPWSVNWDVCGMERMKNYIITLERTFRTTTIKHAFVSLAPHLGQKHKPIDSFKSGNGLFLYTMKMVLFQDYVLGKCYTYLISSFLS